MGEQRLGQPAIRQQIGVHLKEIGSLGRFAEDKGLGNLVSVSAVDNTN